MLMRPSLFRCDSPEDLASPGVSRPEDLVSPGVSLLEDLVSLGKFGMVVVKLGMDDALVVVVVGRDTEYHHVFPF